MRGATVWITEIWSLSTRWLYCMFGAVTLTSMRNPYIRNILNCRPSAHNKHCLFIPWNYDCAALELTWFPVKDWVPGHTHLDCASSTSCEWTDRCLEAGNKESKDFVFFKATVQLYFVSWIPLQMLPGSLKLKEALITSEKQILTAVCTLLICGIFHSDLFLDALKAEQTFS